jgi:hypothetical protein
LGGGIKDEQIRGNSMISTLEDALINSTVRWYGHIIRMLRRKLKEGFYHKN